MKKMMNTFLVTLFLVSFTSACYRKDVQTLVVDVPGLKTPGCAEVVRRFMYANPPVEGLIAVEPSVEAKTVTFEYDSRKIAIKNLEYMLTKAGFEANGNAPDLEAQKKLDPACR